MALHVNIEDLLSVNSIESDRIEFKEGWNPDAIYRSICAFANDFDNIGGGFILVGVEENSSGSATRPVKGLTTEEISNIQRKMIGFNNLIQPVYHAKLFIEEVDTKQIIVLWVPGGSDRPYQVPEQITANTKRNFYYIRKYANSVKAGQTEQQELISLANQIPFDDRTNTLAKIENISILLVKDYLVKINSKLADQVGVKPDVEILGQMELISGPNEHLFPRNVGLMMFSDRPDKFFPYTQVEIVEFPEGDANAFKENEPIQGPIPSQIKRTLDILKDKLIKEKVIKPADKAESQRISSYPLQAIEETLVNAFYHRDYQLREPIEIRIYPGSVIFINQGGPDRSIQLQAFNTGRVRSRRYRNRRLGEFLKELKLTEGRATGIPTILKTLKENGSPPPHFDTDADRTFFEVELMIHPAFIQKAPFTLPEIPVGLTADGVDSILNRLLEYGQVEHTAVMDNVIAGVQAGAIAEELIRVDNQTVDLISTIDSAIVSAIADAVAGAIAANDIKVLEMGMKPNDRTLMLTNLGVSNHRKNYENYMHPLIQKNWLTMTIPNKPTSPNQQYLTTLKGRLVLKILKNKTK